MAAFLAVAGAFAAYMYLRRDEIFGEHAKVAAVATAQASQAAQVPAAASAPIVIAPPNPATTGAGSGVPSGTDNAIAVYSTPAATDGGTRIAVPLPGPSSGSGAADAAPAADLKTTALVGTPVAAIPAPPATPTLADPGTPPLAMAMMPSAAPPSYSSVAAPNVVAPPAPLDPSAAQQVAVTGDSLTVHTSPYMPPTEADPSPNRPIDTQRADFVLPQGGPFIIRPAQCGL